MTNLLYALSLKQPWAALVVHGLKRMEIRRWSTRRRGLILIHASRQTDDRPEGWSLVAQMPAEAAATAALRGGLIGAVEVTDCIAYRDPKAFAADRAEHRNHPDWFAPPVLYGFVLRQPRLLTFRQLPGQVKFFTVAVNEREWAAVQRP